MLKKFTAMAASLLLAVNGLALFPCSTAHAEDEEKGYWKKFSETNLCPAPDIRSTSYIWSIDAEDSEWKYHESTEVHEHPSSGGYDTFGFKMDHYINVTPLADTYRPGDVVELDVDYHFATNIPITVMGQVTGGLGTVHDKEMATDAWQTAEVWLAQDDRTDQFGLTCATSYTSVGNFESETKKFETDVGTSTRNVDGKGTVSTTVQKHSSSDVLAIGINMRVGYGGGNCSTVSLYKWVSEENKPVEKLVPEEKGYWHLNSAKDYGGGTGDNPVKTQHFKSEGGSGYYHANVYQNGSETVYGHECQGEWTDHVLTVYSPLKNKYYAGDTASVGLSYVTNTNIL